MTARRIALVLGFACLAIGSWKLVKLGAVEEPAHVHAAPVAKTPARATPAARIAKKSPTSPPPGCEPPHHGTLLPATCGHGPIPQLEQYPRPRLATPLERRRARRLLAALVAAAEQGDWRNLRAAAHVGYDTRPDPRAPGDVAIRYFHAERGQEPRGRVILNPERPKALIYANAPGRPLVLVGAMWTMRRDELGPTPGGPITRWHTHLICSDGRRQGTKPPQNRICPTGTHLHEGSEMMHVWFTGDLRSAFAISPPEPELCKAGYLPATYCGRF